MAEEKAQNFANHARYVPLYHFVLCGILVVYLAWAVAHIVRHPSIEAVATLLLAVGLLLLYFYARQFALRVQDRVIRLEMRLRLERMLPADLKLRIGELTLGQLIALRFAGDAELPELARKVLAEHITDRKAIKRLVRDWQADYLRV
ncbi:MAG: DUF6526 family protein [Thermoanaerobaculales bacterium]